MTTVNRLFEWPVSGRKNHSLRGRSGRRRTACRIVLLFLFADACLATILSAADQPPDRTSVLNHLNAVIGWYRDAVANVQPGELPSDAIFQQNVRTLAAEAVQLAFQAARAE